ncbi:hypothetical protein AO373_1498 [Moraxella catarrhalis]|nr:hypothetical protein AO379_0614 [Moraxella catarrhalis]OAV17688.1 hypothetical protein AO373_1498 [Moraxella catarrhalis]
MGILLLHFELKALKMGGVVSLSVVKDTALHICHSAYFAISTTP